jgi:probable F420-dependent oxidoreductase
VLRLGLNLPHSDGQMDGRTPRWTDILAMAQAGEALGFDGVWISDHIGFGDPEGEWRGSWESWTLLTAIAASTERVTLGTYVTCAPFRNPAFLAKMAETLDEVSGGRVILGLGAGWNEPEFRAYGFPFEDRFDRFEDSLRIICSMLRTGTAHHDGRVVQARGARIEPRGPRPGGLPIMVGAAAPRMLRLTAELADHWNGSLRAPGELEGKLRAVDDACRAAGRDPVTLRRSVEVLVRTLPAGDDQPPEERELRGTPEQLARVLLGYADLGIDELQVQLRPNTLEAVEAFRPVLGAVRNAARDNTGREY